MNNSAHFHSSLGIEGGDKYLMHMLDFIFVPSNCSCEHVNISEYPNV